jgi:hypothetical protein
MKFFSVLFLIVGLIVSCVDPVYYDGDSVDCYNCYQEMPDSADLIIDLTVDDENPQVLISVYSGKANNSPLISQFDADTSTVFVYVPVNSYYSVEAVYQSDDNTIRAIDGDMLEVKLVTELCDEDCWYIVGGEFDVKLRK